MAAIHNWSNSVRGLLDTLGVFPAKAGAPSTLEGIRQAMLDALGAIQVPSGPASDGLVQKIRVHHRIRTGKDAQALWYLRSDLMQLLSASAGEIEAVRCLEEISPLFEGQLPPGLMPRRAFRYDSAHARQHHD